MIRVRQVKVSINKDTHEQIIKKTADKLHLSSNDITKLIINKQSIDARNKDNIIFIYEVDIEVKDEKKVKMNNDVFVTPCEKYNFKVTGTSKLDNPIVIVGFGPAGLFSAYMLTKAGYKVIIIERGEKVENRINTVNEFWDNNHLNVDSNVQFGEGGAGTFSDGKLNTLTKDPLFRMKEIFKIFVECGANKDILYSNKPHIGTDILRDVVINLRNKIINYGGVIRYNTKLTDLIIENNQIIGIEVNNKEVINTNNVILAIGHSARDTFEMLYNKKINMEPKSFAVGVRIMHSQKMINKSQYGFDSHPILENANYKLTYQATNKRGVYSFCMCPGGYVVNASSELNHLVINGMSNNKRDSEVANSAIVVSVTPNDFGFHPLDGIKYQRELEYKAYLIGKGLIPLQTYKDFKINKISTSLGTLKPKLKGNYTLGNLNEVLPNYICTSLIEGIEDFGKKIEGFNDDYSLLAGVESRTSSPVRIIRNDLFESSIKGLYPAGEGAGYAGGITTAAMDGIKVAEGIAKIYKPN